MGAGWGGGGGHVSSDPLPQQVRSAALGGDAHLDTRAQGRPLCGFSDEKVKEPGQGQARQGSWGQGRANSTPPPFWEAEHAP